VTLEYSIVSEQYVNGDNYIVMCAWQQAACIQLIGPWVEGLFSDHQKWCYWPGIEASWRKCLYV